MASSYDLDVAQHDLWPLFRIDCSTMVELKAKMVQRKLAGFPNFTLEVMIPTLGRFLSEAAFMKAYDGKLPDGNLAVRVVPDKEEPWSTAFKATTCGEVQCPCACPCIEIMLACTYHMQGQGLMRNNSNGRRHIGREARLRVRLPTSLFGLAHIRLP